MLDKEYIKSFTISLLIVVLSNLSIYLLAWWTGTDRSIINLDYFIPLIFLAFRQKILFVLSFTLVSVCDFLVVFAQIFPFIRLSDLVYLLKFSFISSGIYKAYGAFLLIFLIVQLIVITKLANRNHNKMFLVLFNVSILLYGYHIYFGDSRQINFWKPNRSGMATSQLINYFDYRNRGFVENYEKSGEIFQSAIMSGATSELFKELPTNKKVFLVVNESWGVTHDPLLQKNVLNPVLNNHNIVDVKQRELDFKGFTLGGELRELCQKAPVHFNLKDQVKGFEKCLPNLFKQQGYQTIAVHGALGLMYDRQDWYPRAGFQKMLFRDQDLNLPNSHCFSFPGNCDYDIARKVTQEFNANDQIFLYWLTLNTHAVYDKRDLVVDLFTCTKFGIKENTASCRNLKLQKQFFHTLAQMLKSPAFSGTKVIVVGDHQPPIIKDEISVFKDSKVPVLEFEVQ